MNDLTLLMTDMAWPLAILIAWLAGEMVQRLANIPRISTYAIIGFLLAPTQTGFLPSTQSATVLLLANIAFGLLLFECGYRINLRWLRTNPWLTISSLAEASLTFAVVYLLAQSFQQTNTISLLLAALSMATSPATLVRVITEQHSSGQVTERALHLAACNSVLAVLAFKVIVGLVIFKTSGSLLEASYSSLVVLLASISAGAAFGALIPAMLRMTKRINYDSTLVFTIAIIVLVSLTHSLKLSPILATLTFGIFARHRRISLSASQRGFGALGDLLSVFLFVFIATTLEWRQVIEGMGLGLAIIGARQIAKTIGITLFAHWSGISWRKGLLIGMAVTPISAFVILVLEQSRHLGINLVDQLAPLAATALTLEVFGPMLTQRALIWAHEVSETKESRHDA